MPAARCQTIRASEGRIFGASRGGPACKVRNQLARIGRDQNWW